MSTLATIIARQPSIYQKRYASAYWINWANELLEKLSGNGFTFPSLDFETGHVVENDVWIDRPSGCRQIKDIFNPGNSEQTYNWEETNGRIKLVGASVDDASELSDAVAAFTNQNVAYIDVDIDDAVEDEYADCLLVITAGTYAGNTYQIASNDAVGGGVTRLYFLHELSTAITAPQATAGYLADPDNFVMMKWTGSFNSVSATSDEMPIDDLYEVRISNAWMRMKCERETYRESDEAKTAERDFNNELKSIKAERRTITGRVRARAIPGLAQYSARGYYPAKSYEEEI